MKQWIAIDDENWRVIFRQPAGPKSPGRHDILELTGRSKGLLDLKSEGSVLRFNGWRNRRLYSGVRFSRACLTQAFVMTACTLTLAGCMTQPTMQTGHYAEVIFDGLVRLDRSNFGSAWVKPEIDLAHYNAIIVEDPEFEFRTVQNLENRGSRTAELPLTQADKQSLIDTIHESFVAELVRSQYFTLATEPGPDVIIVRIRLLDVVALVPQEPVDVPEEPWSSSVGEGTLVLEVHDSVSGEILYRAVQRRAARTTVGGAAGSRMNSWAEIEPAARGWAKVIREQLDRMHNLT
jgi:hypothetical protein